MRPVVLALVVLISSAPAASQCGDAADGPAGPLVATTLPDSVLAYLERHQASPHVRAFLIAHVATSVPAGSLPRPPLARCAAAFLETELDDPARLTDLLADLRTETLLHALRQAETERLRGIRDRQGLTGLVEYLEDRKDVDEDAFAGDVAFALGRLPTEAACAGPCARLRTALETVDAETDAMSTARTTQADAAEGVRTARGAFAEASRGADDAAARYEVACESAPEGAEPCPPPPTDVDTCPADHPALAACQGVRDAQTDAETARSLLEGAEGRATAAAAAVRRAREDRDRASAELYRVLWTVREELTAATAAPTALRPSDVLPAGVEVDRRFRRPDREATPLAAEAAAPPPADLLVGLTDFVIDRARQEAVYSFVQTLYDRMRPADGAPDRELRALLSSTFRDTYRLMDALADGAGPSRRLPIRQAAQVPLATWRATLRADFESLPLRLGTDPDLRVCPLADAGCAASLAVAGVPLRVGASVLDGEPVFAALAEATSAPFPPGPAFEGREEVAFALRVVGGLADAYRIQGQAGPGAATPLLLTPRALGASADRTGEALLRVALGQAFEAVRIPGVAVAPADFEVAVRHTVGRIETLATMLGPAAEGDRPTAAATLQAALAVVASGARIGRACGLDSVRLARVETLWAEADQTATALARREYGLALARTARLLSTLRGDGHPLPARAAEMLGLASALAEAQTQRDVRLAFEAAASPIGGWEAKRYGRGALNDGAGLTLTAYPGAGLGPEVLARDLGPDGTFADEVGLAVGVALPVGVHYSLTRGDDADRDWSVGLFLPVFDLGALFSARLGDDDVGAVANTSVQQVFAPGAFLTVGAKSVPLTFTAGPQFVPNLRTAGDGAPAESAVQFRFAVGLDVVLFEF